MKRNLLVLMLVAATAITMRANLTMQCTTTENNGVKSYKFSISDASQQDTYYLELSVHDDFSRVRNIKVTIDNYKKWEKSYKETALPEGDYYWRLRCKSDRDKSVSFTYPTPGDPLHFSGAPAEVKEAVDPTEFSNFTTPDGTELKLSSVWLRADKTGNRIFASIDLPGECSYKEDITPNHGMIVDNGTIYISRGGEYTSGWDSDKKRVWLERYDLLTGRELNMLWVYAPNDDVYPLEVMPWIGTDDDGTVYFTTAGCRKAKQSITLYTIDLTGVETSTKSIVANKIITVSSDDIELYRFVTVSGSIKNGNYEIWTAGNNYWEMKNGDDVKFPICRWKVDGTNVTPETSMFAEPPYLIPPVTTRTEIDFEMKLHPLGDDMFYVTAYSIDSENYVLSPTLLRFVADGRCEHISDYTANTEAVPGTCEKIHISGIAPFHIAGNDFLAYGISTDNGSAAQIVHTPSPTADFSKHTLAWRPGEATGFSSENRYQGMTARFLPDDATPASGGILVVYCANGGLGTYRLDNLSATTVGLANAVSPQPRATYRDGVISFTAPVEGLTITDMAGRTIMSTKAISSQFATGNIIPGIYMLSSPSIHGAIKIAIGSR